MFSLTIVFGPRATTWTLMFKTKEGAEAARQKINDRERDKLVQEYPDPITDDFGQSALCFDIYGCMLEDLSLSREVYIEKSLHEARIMMDAQKRAQNEKGRIVPMGGPAMIHPNIR